ncbi:MAG: glycogen debranching protein [Calditrichaeota bacterium]|nr:glycogen debranching protein [Calditrichota bacterium]
MQNTIYESKDFKIFPNKIIQGQYYAEALSPEHIISTYQSNYKAPTKKELFFKFSLNGGDNERFPGEDHRIILDDGNPRMISAVYVFGENDPEQVIRSKVNGGLYLTKTTTVTFRCDLNNVLNDFKTKGFYITRTGEKITKEQFNGLYIAGAQLPLNWEFASLSSKPEFRLKDEDNDGIFEITLKFKPTQVDKINESGKREWRLSKDISSLPQYESGFVLTDALYKLSLEEMLLDIREDGAFMAGQKWPGVWTRDISYSILLSLAAINPEASVKSLKAKVKNDRIIQDTGTGGSWPVSTDRMTWALAAWEVYKTTGDRDWLKYAYTVIKNSAMDDLKTAYNRKLGLFYGESSFLDWREQTYPLWMNPRDIYVSMNLGTNAVHYQTYRILSEMAGLLGEDNRQFIAVADQVRKSVNKHLWMEEQGYYGQFLYGRNYMSLSPRSETLGEALTVLFGISNPKQSASVIENMPVVAFGPTCIYPQIPDIPPYHNNAIWPFVVSFWTWASATTGNEKAVEHGLASVYRQAGLFLNNQENMVSHTGDFMGTEINSQRQLWSVAGNLATVYRVMFGMNFLKDGIEFRPFVPKAYQSKKRLKNFRYRKATFNITLSGYGNKIAQITLDGRLLDKPVIPADLSGEHEIDIQLANNDLEPGTINLVGESFSPATPVLNTDNNKLNWKAVAGAEKYGVYKNGEMIAYVNALGFDVNKDETAEYQVCAIDADGVSSFLSEPIEVINPAEVRIIEIEDFTAQFMNRYKGYSGKGYLKSDKEQNIVFKLTLNVPKEGDYKIDLRYANGEGPINTNNKCAIRSLYVDNERIGAMVFPQRGNEVWDDWGYSNAQKVHLSEGKHVLELRFDPSDENMNGKINRVFLDHLRVRFVSEK